MFAFTIPGLEWLSKAFAYLLHWIAAVTGGNYGVAIILLTFIMRLVILPLSIKQTKSMVAMQKLQPQLKEIQKKYKDDREKQGQEMMKLYKENKVSPLGGCLPLLLQLPIMFAVFDVLHSLANPAKSKYVSIIGANPNLNFLGMQINLTGAKIWNQGGYAQVIILILLTVATGYVSAKMMTSDPKQAKMMAMMPVLMGVFAWILPAGVTIYIIVTNIFTMVQQYIQLEHEGFYDVKLAEIRKMGEEAKLHKRLYLKSMDTGTKILFAVRLRSKPVAVPTKKKSAEPKQAKGDTSTAPAARAVKAGKETEAKKPQAKKQQAGGEAGSSSGKKGSAAKPGGKPGDEPVAKTGGKTASAKNYPAKKKGSVKK